MSCVEGIDFQNPKILKKKDVVLHVNIQFAFFVFFCACNPLEKEIELITECRSQLSTGIRSCHRENRFAEPERIPKTDLGCNLWVVSDMCFWIFAGLKSIAKAH